MDTCCSAVIAVSVPIPGSYHPASMAAKPLARTPAVVLSLRISLIMDKVSSEDSGIAAKSVLKPYSQQGMHISSNTNERALPGDSI